MGSTRFFLADLPSRTTEQDLRSLFQDYGHVERVELKTKEQIIDAGETVTKVIAFVTVQTDDAHYCLNELNWQKLHGYKLKVSLAKESFLDRLKRERDEGQQDGQQQTDAHNDYQSSSRLLAQNTQNKRRVFGEHEEINDDEVPIELLITKKRAANSMHNGKIVIQQEQDVKPLHIIEQHKKQKKANLDAKATIADQKRKESLNKMQQQHQQKKSAIQIALSSEAGQAKRIKFSDAEEDDDEEEQQKQKKQTKMDLFDDDDEEEEDAEGFQLPQHSGKKGERLVEMQSKQSLDPRFRITSNFVADDDNDEDENEQEDEEHHEPQSGQEVSERNWQMGILEQVIGRKIDTAKSDPSKASKSKKMLRFDPAKEEHQKLLRTKAKKPDVVRQQSTDEAVEESATSGTAPVSQSAFYVVTDTLKESLKMRGEGFSLLDMFGSSHEEAAAERQDQLEKLGHEKILVNSKANSSKLGLQSANPFSYDSSDSDEEDEVTEEPATASKENEAPVVKQKQKKQQIQLESFFIPKNDVRLKEGAKFFKSSKPELENENYDEVKKRLKLLITKKIAKTQKAMPGSKTAKKSKSKK